MIIGLQDYIFGREIEMKWRLLHITFFVKGEHWFHVVVH